MSLSEERMDEVSCLVVCVNSTVLARKGTVTVASGVSSGSGAMSLEVVSACAFVVCVSVPVPSGSRTVRVIAGLDETRRRDDSVFFSSSSSVPASIMSGGTAPLIRGEGQRSHRDKNRCENKERACRRTRRDAARAQCLLSFPRQSHTGSPASRAV
jgi:hypothetical protein